MTDHPPFNHFYDYVEGNLADQSRMRFEEHLNTGCKVCIAELGRVQRLFDALEAARWPTPSPAARDQVMRSFSQTIGRKRSRQARLRWALAGGLMLILLLFVISPPWTTQQAFAATLVEMDGPVFIVPAASGSDETAVLGQSISIDTSVLTGPGANAALTLPGDILIRLGESTELLLSELSHSQDRWQVILFQSRGKTESSVEPGIASLTIQTPAGEVVAVGTFFTVRVDDDDSTVVTVVDGDVQITSAHESVHVSSGMSAYLSTGRSATIIPSQRSTPSLDAEDGQDALPTVTPSMQVTTDAQDPVEPTEDYEIQTPEPSESPEEDESPEP